MVIYTSLSHTCGIRSHKPVTLLHRVYIYSHLHSLSPSLRILPQTGARSPPLCSLHKHTLPLTPSMLHHGELSHPLLPELGAEGGGPRCQDGLLRAPPFTDGSQRDWTPKSALPSRPLAAFGRPSALRACPARGSPDEGNSVSKLHSTDNLFRPIGHPACSASLTPHGLTQTLYTPLGGFN